MKKTYNLTVEKRDTVGHRVKHLRKNGSIPGSVYGKGFESTAIVVNHDLFTQVYDEAGETHVVNLTLANTTVPVLIHHVQVHPVTQKILHLEFLKVNLKEKLKTTVPVTITGESPAVSQGLGTLLTVIQEIEIEAFPSDIPESLSVDISTLSEVDQELAVKDLTVPHEVTVITDAEQTLVKIGALTVEEPPAETTEGAEGETTATETAETDKKEAETPSEA